MTMDLRRANARLGPVDTDRVSAIAGSEAWVASSEAEDDRGLTRVLYEKRLQPWKIDAPRVIPD